MRVPNPPVNGVFHVLHAHGKLGTLGDFESQSEAASDASGRFRQTLTMSAGGHAESSGVVYDGTYLVNYYTAGDRTRVSSRKPQREELALHAGFIYLNHVFGTTISSEQELLKAIVRVSTDTVHPEEGESVAGRPTLRVVFATDRIVPHERFELLVDREMWFVLARHRCTLDRELINEQRVQTILYNPVLSPGLFRYTPPPDAVFIE